MSTGLVIGRFCPPHRGHSHLIATAAAGVDDLTVIVFSKDEEPVPGELRATWLAQLHPGVRVVNVHTDLVTDWDDEETWQRWVALIRGVVPAGPDTVFSSEPYGGELARRLGAADVVVDAERAAVPVSASMIRADPGRHLRHLSPKVRMWVGKTWLGCELCEAARLTEWHHEDDVCWIADCEACNTPMVVWQEHGVEPPAPDVEHMLGALARVAAAKFGEGNFTIDRNMRQIPEHFHAHARDTNWWFRRGGAGRPSPRGSSPSPG
jgi:nicotinamide mononucleotide adenylyltransferase